MITASWKFAPLPKDMDNQRIPEFSVDLHWDEYPRVVDIENKFDCNAKSLHKCDINDPTTLFGCRELTARCHHFDRDVTLRDVDGKDILIPKNATETEGYAMAITDIVKACNPYHGDLVLVSVSNDSEEYMLICSCKNPGYIGNDHLLGNCETLFICDGKIDNINQPLEKIECVCRENEHSVRYETGLPTCKPLLVFEANQKYPQGWTHLVPYIHSRQLPMRTFNPTIRGNVKVNTLLDPCRSSIHDMSIEIPDGRYDSVLQTCGFSETGYPVESAMLIEPRKGRSEKETLARIGAVLATGPYEMIRVTDQIAGRRKLSVIKAAMKFDGGETQNRSVIMRLPQFTGIGKWSQVFMETSDSFIGGRCAGSWPSYTCKMLEYFKYKTNGIPMSGFRLCPSEFLWSFQNWNESERMAQWSVTALITGVLIDQEHLTKLRSVRLFGLLLRAKRLNQTNGLVGFVNKNDFTIHLNSITPTND
nr:pif-1 [Apis mellifera nudivirus]